MADEFGYSVELIDIGKDLSVDELAARNVHGIARESILHLSEKRQDYSVSDARAAAKKLEKDSKEVAALRKKWAAKVLDAVTDNDSSSNASASAVSSSKIRLEVCANNGQANPVKVLVVRADEDLAEVTKQAAKKMALQYSAEKTRLFDNKGADVTVLREGLRVFVSADGKDFIPMLVKQTAAQRREAKQKLMGTSDKSRTNTGHAVLSSLSKLTSGVVEIVDGLFIGSGRDGRDVEQLNRLRIDTVINVAKDWPKFEDPDRLSLHFGLVDEWYARLDHVIAPVLQATASGKCLVHCITGISRSAAVIAAILICKHKMSLLDAVKLLKSKRSIVCINPGFILNLLQLEEATLRKRSDLALGGGKKKRRKAKKFFLNEEPLVLFENGSDPQTFMKKVGSVSERYSHVWWTPQFRDEDSVRIPVNLRNALAVANSVFDGSHLLERREGRFRMHFDVDVVVDEPHFDSLRQFFEAAMVDFEAVLTAEERSSLNVSGSAGPFRGRFKYGLHLTCANVLVDEAQFVDRTVRFRSDLMNRNCTTWCGADADWNAIVDSMDCKMRRCFNSDRVVCCNQCRKKNVVNDKSCQWCFGVGTEPPRRHELLLVGPTGVEGCSMFPPPTNLAPILVFQDIETISIEDEKAKHLHCLEFLNNGGKDAAAKMAKTFQLNISRHQTHRNLYQFCYDGKNSMMEHPLVQVRKRRERRDGKK